MIEPLPHEVPAPLFQINMNMVQYEVRGLDLLKKMQDVGLCRVREEYNPNNMPHGQGWSYIAPSTYIQGTEAENPGDFADYLRKHDDIQARVHILSFTTNTLDPLAMWGGNVPPFAHDPDWIKGLGRLIQSVDAILCSYEVAVEGLRQYNPRAFYVPDVKMADASSQATFIRSMADALDAAREHRASRFKRTSRGKRIGMLERRKMKRLRAIWKDSWCAAADEISKGEPL